MDSNKSKTARTVQEILVIRPLRIMALALTTQKLSVTAYEFSKDLIHLTRENVYENLQYISSEFPNRKFQDGIKGFFTVYNIIHSIKPDVIHVNALQDLIFVSIAARLCGLKGHRPSVLAMSHNPLTWSNTKNARKYALIIKFLADGFIALATTHKKLLVQMGVPENRIVVIPNPYDNAFLQANGLGEEKKENGIIRITYIANICHRKAQDVLIRAASEIVKKYPNCQFEIAGKVVQGEETYSEQLRSLVKQYGIEDAVHFWGGIPHQEVISLLQKSDIFIFPSLAEMMPRAVIEAMLLGKPVIASGVDGILDLIEDHNTGLLVEPGNIKQLITAISELINNPDLANQLGMSGQKYILNYCSPERVGKEFLTFYEGVLNKSTYRVSRPVISQKSSN